MRNCWGYVFGLVTLLAIVACDNDIDLVESGEPIPIVYGLMQASDENHFIRVEQSFIDETTSALILADDPDNLYYEDIEVQLSNLTTGDTSIMQRIDGDTLGYPREDGVFAQSPNVLYTVANTDLVIDQGDELALQVFQGDQILASASTTVVEEVNLVRPRVNRESEVFNAANPAGIRVQFSHPSPTALFDVSVVLTILEGGTFREIPVTLIEGTDERSFFFPLEDFYSKVRAALINDPVVERELISARFLLVASGDEISDFLRVQSANLGVTSSQEPPRYTNIEGGLGVFSSRSLLVTRELSPTSATIDSLANGVFTSDLGFQM